MKNCVWSKSSKDNKKRYGLLSTDKEHKYKYDIGKSKTHSQKAVCTWPVSDISFGFNRVASLYENLVLLKTSKDIHDKICFSFAVYVAVCTLWLLLVNMSFCWMNSIKPEYFRSLQSCFGEDIVTFYMLMLF